MRRQSLTPPSPNTISWEEYVSADNEKYVSTPVFCAVSVRIICYATSQRGKILVYIPELHTDPGIWCLCLLRPHLGRELVCKESKKNFKATIAMSQEFPLGIESWVAPSAWCASVELLSSVTTCFVSGCWMCWRWLHPSSTLINSGSLCRWSSLLVFLSNSVRELPKSVYTGVNVNTNFLFSLQTSPFSPRSQPPSPFRSFATTSSTSPCSSFPVTIKKTPAAFLTFKPPETNVQSREKGFYGTRQKKPAEAFAVCGSLQQTPNQPERVWGVFTLKHFFKFAPSARTPWGSEPLRPEAWMLFRITEVILIKGTFLIVKHWFFFCVHWRTHKPWLSSSFFFCCSTL